VFQWSEFRCDGIWFTITWLLVLKEAGAVVGQQRANDKGVPNTSKYI
jgi:hypothetical protein